MTRSYYLCSIGLVFLCAPYFLCAQDADSVSFYQLTLEDFSKTKVSVASKISQTRSEAPGVISLVSGEEMQQYGWYSGNQVLYRLPGFSPSQDYDRRTVSGRGVFEGWNNNHLLMLIDGVQFNDNLYGTAYTWEMTPLVMVQSMEVVRGPASALYGTNAVNGVVSLNTLSVEDLDGSGMAQIRMGSQGTQIYDIVLGTSGRRADVIAAFNYFETDGNQYETYDDSFRTDSLGNALTFDVNDRRESQYFFTKIEGKGAFKGLSMQFHEQSWGFETGHGWLFNIPDQPEDMNERRRVIFARYSTDYRKEALSQEYTLRYQKHSIDWDMRYYPDGAFDGFYPYGVTEYLKTQAEDVLARAQWTYKFRGDAAFLGGIEQNVFFYRGDEAHNSNIDLESTFEPFPNNTFKNMGPWFEFVEKQPVNNTGIFMQFISPRLLGKRLQATVSLRYDRQAFNYTDIYAADRPTVSKEFSQLSPRLGLVFKATEELTIKGLAGRAFRTPSPTEMFGANTYTLASNITELRPETITTFELDMEWEPNKRWRVQATGFYNSNFEGIIAYSVANTNLSTNLYDLSTAGLELEAQLDMGDISGFANYTYAHRISETIVDATIAEDAALTWVPAHAINWGVNYKQSTYYASLSGRWQGAVKRRASGITDDSQDFRPDEVPAWLRVDAKIAITALKHVEVGLLLQNALNSTDYLIKNNAYRFDYQMPKRQYLLNVLYKF